MTSIILIVNRYFQWWFAAIMGLSHGFMSNM